MSKHPLYGESPFPSDERAVMSDRLPKYRSGMLLGIVMEYIGELGIYLVDMKVVCDALIFQFSRFVFYTGFVMILIFTYQYCKTLKYIVIMRILAAIANVFLIINIAVTCYLLYIPKKIANKKAVP